MKGTIVILGCLFAAYAAPLFANEVPLILDETIQMPESTWKWDALLSPHGEVWFIMASSSRIYYRTLEESGDSGSHYFDEPMRMSQVVLYWSDDENPRYWCQYDTSGYTCARPAHVYRQYNLLDGEPYSPRFFWPSNCGPDWWGNPVVDDPMTVEFVEMVPTDGVPAIVLSVLYRSGYNSSRAYKHSTIYVNGYEGGVESYTIEDASNILFSQWHERLDGVAIVRPSSYPRRTLAFRTLSIEDDTLIVDAAQSLEIDTVWEHYRGALLFYDVCNQRREVVVFSESGVIRAFDLDHNERTWEIWSTSSAILKAYAVNNECSEQLLLLNDNHQFEIIQIETGNTWGTTSQLEPGHSSMKIIGNYHKETRRLIVRFGTELRIYRFGEPIYTDADDARPELPNELTLSAYPNPFNPTTMIAYDLLKAVRANLTIFDLNGRQVKMLFDEQMSAGSHEFGFDGADLPSGIYFARLSAGELARTQKLVLLK